MSQPSPYFFTLLLYSVTIDLKAVTLGATLNHLQAAPSACESAGLSTYKPHPRDNPHLRSLQPKETIQQFLFSVNTTEPNLITLNSRCIWATTTINLAYTRFLGSTTTLLFCWCFQSLPRLPATTLSGFGLRF